MNMFADSAVEELDVGSDSLLAVPLKKKSNNYLFVGGNPINRVDPTGLASSTASKFLDSPADKRDAYYTKFAGAHLALIKEQAKKHCVPWRLLALILINEDIDVNWGERNITDPAGGGSVGLGQITVPTALRENVIDNVAFGNMLLDNYLFMHGSSSPTLPGGIDPNIVGTYRRIISGGSIASVPNIEIEVRKWLESDFGSVSTAAALLRKYIDYVSAEVKGGLASADFLSNLSTGSSNKSDYSAFDDCNCGKIYDMVPPKYLAQALAAMWNNGRGITRLTNVQQQALNAYKHGINAGSVYDDLKAQPWWN